MLRLIRQSPAVASGSLIAVVLIINVATMPGMHYGGDPDAMREEARNIVLHGSLAADPDMATHLGEPGQFFVLNHRDHRYYSKYGLMNSLMYVPPFFVERLLRGHVPVDTDRFRLTILNYYNVALSVAIAALLFRITGSYARDPWARVAFVLASFYGTFLWNYLRAHASEIFQVLHFLAFYFFFNRVLRTLFPPEGKVPQPPRPLDLMLSWLFIDLLILTRVTYGLLLAAPWIAIGYAVLVARKSSSAKLDPRLLWSLLVPSLCILGTIGGANWLKFGSPFLTGYHQWGQSGHSFGGDLHVAIYGFLFSVQKSIFIHFPILALALIGYYAFAKRCPTDTVLMLGVFLAFLIAIGKMPIWRGDWCYGPRYLLFVLPILSLPFVTALDHWFARPLRLSSLLGFVLSACVIGVSIGCQIEVNRLPFSTYFEILRPIEKNMSIVAADYFLNSHFAKINADLALVQSDPDRLVYIRDLKGQYDDQFVSEYISFLRVRQSTSNYYWRNYSFLEFLWRRFASFTWLWIDPRVCEDLGAIAPEP
jgi:hypothetical protein